MQADVIGAEATTGRASGSRTQSIDSGDAAAGSAVRAVPAPVRPADMSTGGEILPPEVQPPRLGSLHEPPVSNVLSSRSSPIAFTPSLVPPGSTNNDDFDQDDGSTRIPVVLDLDNLQLAAEKYNKEPQSPPGRPTSSQMSSEEQPEFLTVSRTWSGTSRFLSTGSKSFCSEEHARAMASGMESKFATNKYMNFRTSFMMTALAYVIGAGLFSISELLTEKTKEGWQLGRIVLLGGVVAPMYLIYFVCTWRYHEAYYKLSGTWMEYALWGLFCMHSLAIALADWRFTRKYGMLVMHISFIENFSPVREIAMHTATLGCAILPYSFLKIFAYIAGDSDLTNNGADSDDTDSSNSLFPQLCIDTEGIPVLLLDIFVPMVLFCYQVISTTDRDMSLRLDFLGNYQLRNQTEKLKVEKTKCEDLLRSMLPKRIIKLLMAEEQIEAQLFSEVTVIFAEICDFSHLCSQLSPSDVVEVLNIIYLEIDWLSDELHVYKVETVGQVYMAVVGCPDAVVNHADVAAHFALAAQRRMRNMRARIADVQNQGRGEAGSSKIGRPSNQGVDCKPAKQNTSMVGMLRHGMSRGLSHASLGSTHSGRVSKQTISSSATSMENSSTTKVLRAAFAGSFDVSSLQIRVGLNSGKIRAGVVGLECPRFKLFGDTVNTASRMESTCEPGMVQMSTSTKGCLNCADFVIQERGEIPVKGKGFMRTAYILGLQQGDSDGIRRLTILKGNIVRFSQRSVQGAAFADQDADPEEVPHSLVVEPPKIENLQNIRRNTDERFPLETDRSARSSMDDEVDVSFGIGRKSHDDFVDDSRKHPETSWQTRIKRLNFSAIKRSQSEMVVESHYRYNSGLQMLSSYSWAPVGWDCHRIKHIFLLVPLHQKDPGWMATLEADQSFFEAEVLYARILWARKITIVWLLLLSLVSILDSTMDVLDESQSRYRSAVLFRAVGCNVAGMSYLMVLVTPIFRKYPQCLTIAMLTSMGAALLACGAVIYNSESAIIAMYGAYVLFYDICRMAYRAAICAFAVLFYLVLGWCTCGIDGVVQSAANTAFLVVFFVSMGCGLHLKEHMEHVAHFEQRRIAEKFADIQQAETVSSELLNSLLPPHVVEKVGLGISPIAEHVSDVTILFSDMKGFTNFSSGISPSELVNVLNAMYSAFDEIIVSWDLYRVEIIGDAYFVSSGCPVPENPKDRCSADDNAMKAVEVAFAMLRSLPRVCEDPTVQMRLGLHTGSVVAGVVGKKGPRYHLFGAAVQKAEFMESSGLPGHVHISSETHEILVKGGHLYAYTEHQVEKDGGGSEKTWFVKPGQNKKAFKRNKAMLAKKRQDVRSPRADPDEGQDSPRALTKIKSHDARFVQ